MKKIVSVILISTLLVCTGAISIFADTLPTGTRNQYQFSGLVQGQTGAKLSLYVVASCYDPYYSFISDNNYEYIQDYNITVSIANNTNDIVLVPVSSFLFQLTLSSYNYPGYFDNDNEGWKLGNPVSSDYTFAIVGNSATTCSIRLALGDQFFCEEHSYYTISPHARHQFTFNISRVLTKNFSNLTAANINTYVQYYKRSISNCTLSSPTPNPNNSTEFFVTVDNTVHPYSTNYLIYHLDQNVQSILDQYTANSQNAQAVTDGTQTNEQTLSNIGTNEDTWFTQNDQALQATGITNFNYTPTIMSGMSVISDQFNRLWIAIGDWNFVYTFSMMLGLVVLILRHNPQRKKSSSNSSGGGKSNAASS